LGIGFQQANALEFFADITERLIAGSVFPMLRLDFLPLVALGIVVIDLPMFWWFLNAVCVVVQFSHFDPPVG
jgi:hypothetical protein